MMKKIFTGITEEELNKLYKRISKNVNYYRLYNNSMYADEEGRISQEKLAELCHVSRSLIANIESVKVKQTFSIAVIASISKVLNVPFENFLKKTNNSQILIDLRVYYYILKSSINASNDNCSSFLVDFISSTSFVSSVVVLVKSTNSFFKANKS